MDIPKIPPVQKIVEQLFIKKEISFSVLRLDLIHPYISGNKWFKLKYNIDEFLAQKKEYLVTFGGAYSNHIVATAAAGKELGIKTIGIIRGNELNENSNPALKFASACGMKLFFVSREEYKQMRESGLLTDRFLLELQIQNSDLYSLPEGGSNSLSVKGCAEIVKLIPSDFDFICCACGTGATLAGISTALNENQKAIGILVLQGEKFLRDDILKLNGGKNNFQLITEYSFGGYAKTNTALDLLCENFSLKNGFKIEPVYTGKLFFGLHELIRKDFFKKGSKLIVVHTGGVFHRNDNSPADSRV